MIESNLPALQVIVPLLAALFCAMFRKGLLAWAIAVAASWAAFAIAVTLLLRVQDGAVLSYMMGGWPAPLGIEYRIDIVNAFVLLIVSGIGAVVMTYARRSIESEIAANRQAWFYAMFMLCLAGQLGVTITGDAFNIFVFLEISSLSSYVMIAMGRDRRALVASYRYLIMGTIGATFIVIGIGLLWTLTGTLNLYDLAQRLAEIRQSPGVLSALAFLAVGISLKLALFPLHLWLPNAYAYAPSVASAFMAGTSTKVAIYLFLRFFFTIFGGNDWFEATAMADAFIVLSLAAMFGASTVAVFQNDLKRMLAYSSVGQIGYITLGIGMASKTALTGSIVHMFNHGVMKTGFFLLVGGIVLRLRLFRIEDLAGIGRKMPLTMAGFTILGLSMLGTPGTVGFISKWYLAKTAVERGWWWMVLLIVGSSLLSMLYIGRVVEVAYFRKPSAAVEQVREAPLSLLAPAWLMVALSIWFGIDADVTIGFAERAAEALVTGAY